MIGDVIELDGRKMEVVSETLISSYSKDEKGAFTVPLSYVAVNVKPWQPAEGDLV